MSILAESDRYTLNSSSSITEAENMERMSSKRNRILEQRHVAEQRNKEFNAFTSESKNFLLTESMFYVLRKCLPTNIDESYLTQGRSIIESFIIEEGSDNLLRRFSTKTLLLSEIGSIVEETHKKVIHGCSGKCADTPFKISNSDMKLFHDRLDNLDTDTVTKQIISRVTKAEEEFVKANIKDKEVLEKLSSDTEEKLNNIKNKDEDTEKALKQEAVAMYRSKVNSISNRKKGILESIVNRMAKSIVAEESVLESYKLENGKLDMQKIIDTSEVMYTFLEMVNSMKIRDIDNKYLTEVINSIA